MMVCAKLSVRAALIRLTNKGLVSRSPWLERCAD